MNENPTAKSRSWLLPTILGLLIAILIGAGVLFMQKGETTDPNQAVAAAATPLASPSLPSGLPSPDPSASPLEAAASPAPAASAAAPTAATSPDLSVDAAGLSKATAILQTSYGPIKFKFYPKDAPNTVNRIIELARAGFYNGLIFHRVVPGFVIQGGDPVGNGTGGSGQKLKAEFNKRRHVEGAVAMARAMDPDSADSQFYISLGTHPHLDNNYTVFGQVIEGIDIARKIKPGDKMLSITIE